MSGEIVAARTQPVRDRRRRPTRFAPASATCPRTAGSTASCSRCRSRPTPASRVSRAVSRRGLIDRARGTRAAERLRRAVAHQGAVAVRRRSATLSGGNQQKVALARWLSITPVGPHPRRADAGRRRRLEGRDPRADADARRARPGDHHDLVGAAGDPRHERSHRRDARPAPSAACSTASEATQASILALALTNHYFRSIANPEPRTRGTPNPEPRTRIPVPSPNPQSPVPSPPK